MLQKSQRYNIHQSYEILETNSQNSSCSCKKSHKIHIYENTRFTTANSQDLPNCQTKFTLTKNPFMNFTNSHSQKSTKITFIKCTKFTKIVLWKLLIFTKITTTFFKVTKLKELLKELVPNLSRYFWRKNSNT